MKIIYLILVSAVLISCNADDVTNNTGTTTVKTPKQKPVEDKYNWEELLLTTGYVDNVKELSDFQSSQLELIRYNFPKIEKIAFNTAAQLYDEFYQDSIKSDSLYLSGVHIFNDTTEVIEFYFKSDNINRTLIPIVLFKKFKLLGTTYID